MPNKKQTHPSYMRRCVARVSKDKDLSSAFAICTSAMQKAGYIEPGTRTQTKAGVKRARHYSAKKDFKDMEKEYEKALDQGREESFENLFLTYVEENNE